MRKSNIIKKNRLWLIFSLFVLGICVLIFKLYFVQIVQSEIYLEMADRQNYSSTDSAFERGTIYFTKKDGQKIAAATMKSGYKIEMNPQNAENPEDVFNRLSNILEIDEDKFIAKAFNDKVKYYELADRIEKNTADKILEMDLDGISLYRERWRFYPGNNLAAQTIGFLAYNDENEFLPQYGLERQYNYILDKSDQNVFKNFFIEIFSEIGQTIFENKKPKGNLITTIEPTVQTFLEDVLEKTQEKYNSTYSGAIIMNPQNGEIYALGLNPNFDINNFNLVEDISIYKNDLVQNNYEMGSVVKPLTVAAGIDSGVITPSSTYDDKGTIILNTKTISNYDKKARGVVSMQEVLNQSLNTGVSHITLLMGNEKFSEYFKKFFENPTGIDLPNEAHSLISNLNVDRDLEHANASFGQGIAMSPISITRALASLGNGGKLVTPHIGKAIEYDLGFVQKLNYPEPERVFSEKTSEEISRMLVKVVDDALAGGTVALSNYSIAAKTGTAQIPSPNGGYYEDKYLHSFFGYFPAFNPQFIIFLYIVDPKGVNYASQTLTEPFMDLAKYLINYYEIPPDRENKIKDDNI